MNEPIQTIQIVVDRGRIYYVSELETPVPYLRIWARTGDQVKFVSRYPFAIHFSPISPFANWLAEQGRQIEEPQWELTGQVRPDAEPGYFKFFVALMAEGQLLTDDPDMIVDPARPRR
jgi:hypothetical protein